MGTTSLNLVSKFKAMHGGNITVRVGNYLLARLVAGYTSDLKILKPPKDEKEKDTIKALKRECTIGGAFYNHCDNLNNNVDTISFVTDTSFRQFSTSVLDEVQLFNGLKVRMCLAQIGKNNTLKLVIMLPGLSILGDYTNPEGIRQFLERKYLDGDANIYSLVSTTRLGLKTAVSNFMERDDIQNLINSYRVNIKSTENKFMDAYCLSEELKELTCESMKKGMSSHQITKGPGGRNVAVFYPSRKKFIKWVKNKIDSESEQIKLQATDNHLNKDMFNTEGKINIDKFKKKSERINSFEEYLLIK